MLSSRARSRVTRPVLLVLLLVAVLPWLSADTRTLATLTLGIVYAISAVGLDIFAGYAGQISIGNFGFVAVGAYMSAILSGQYDWNIWATLPASILAAGLVGFVLGIPMIRLSELGAAFVTFFFAFLVTVLIGYGPIGHWTKGQIGLSVPPLTSGQSDIYVYYVGFAVLVGFSLVAARYAECRAGRALRVVKRSPVVAAVLGINVERARLSAFTFSAMAAGAGGFVFAQLLGYLAPDSFPGSASLILLIMAVVGGVGQPRRTNHRRDVLKLPRPAHEGSWR